MLDLFLGDPVYDEQKNIIRRDFGVKNGVALTVVGFAIGSSFFVMGEMKPISGKRKMKGGLDFSEASDNFIYVIGYILVYAFFGFLGGLVARWDRDSYTKYPWTKNLHYIGAGVGAAAGFVQGVERLTPPASVPRLPD